VFSTKRQPAHDRPDHYELHPLSPAVKEIRERVIEDPWVEDKVKRIAQRKESVCDVLRFQRFRAPPRVGVLFRCLQFSESFRTSERQEGV
jgi:hypothetical protein